MPYFKTSQEWLDQSALLIEARPATTKVTTRYSIKPARSRTAEDETSPAIAPAPRAVLVLKTYDPASGVVLKYKTTKAAEVTRLVAAALGRLGRGMAGVPDVPEETMADIDAGVSTPAEGVAEGQPSQSQPEAGKKKKKKGRK